MMKRAITILAFLALAAACAITILVMPREAAVISIANPQNQYEAKVTLKRQTWWLPEGYDVFVTVSYNGFFILKHNIDNVDIPQDAIDRFRHSHWDDTGDRLLDARTNLIIEITAHNIVIPAEKRNTEPTGGADVGQTR
ncbi:MAG: hypothetical protein AB7T27_07550 [Kiritimatiellia bacterium]